MEAQVQATTRYVVYNEEWGIYIGDFLGLTFWSQLDPCGQPEAGAFDTPQLADKLVTLLKENHPEKEFSIHPVQTHQEDSYATIPEILAAGLPGWEV